MGAGHDEGEELRYSQEWQRMAANAQKPHDGCTMNTVKTANGYTFNGSCNIPQGPTLVINGSQTIQDSEQIPGVSFHEHDERENAENG